MLASKAMSWDNVVPASFEFTHRLLVAAYLLTCSMAVFTLETDNPSKTDYPF